MLSTTASRSSSSTVTANRAISHIHMVNSARRSIPVPEDYDHKSTSPKVLWHDTEAIIQCDASVKGLGATQLQIEQPVAFVLHSLTKAEQNFVCMVVCSRPWMYWLKHSHENTMKRHSFSICADQWPLLPIFNKPIYNAPKQLQWMLLRLQKYIHTRTENNIADMLSHAYLQEQWPTN